MKKLFVIILVILMCLSLFAGCREADRVSYNLSQQADNFNVVRRLAVINARSDRPVFEMIGNFSIANNGSSELEITVECEKGVYKQHFVSLNQWTIYVVEDVSGAYVDKYHYEVNFLPEMIVPVVITQED